MVIPKINSAHGSDTRNIINRAIESINAQGKSVQELVAKGQLTPTQYAKLIQTVNGLISKGGVTLDDLNDEVLKKFNEVSPEFNLLSIPRDNSVSPEKTTFIKQLPNLIDKTQMKVDKYLNTSGALLDSPLYDSTDFIPVEEQKTYTFSEGVRSIAFYNPDKSFNRMLISIDQKNNKYTFTVPLKGFIVATVHKDLSKEIVLNAGTTVDKTIQGYGLVLDERFKGASGLDEYMTSEDEIWEVS